MKSYKHVNNSSTFSLNSKISRCHSSAQKKIVLPWNNYRPVSVLPNLSKIFENILYNQIAPYFKINLPKFQTWLPKGLLSTKLFSSDNTKVQKLFRSGGGAYTALLTDVTKALICLLHDLIISKLHVYGFDMTSLRLIQSYSTDRYQRVKVNNSYYYKILSL